MYTVFCPTVMALLFIFLSIFASLSATEEFVVACSVYENKF